jgi:small subunit ribosomal protein S5
LGKGKEVTDAISKGAENAKKTLIRVPVVNGTLPHEIKGKYGAGKVFLKPASPGTGVIAGGGVRAIMEAAGIHDVLSKSMGSNNPHNVVKATMNALVSLVDMGTLAQRRGISVQEVFSRNQVEA